MRCHQALLINEARAAQKWNLASILEMRKRREPPEDWSAFKTFLNIKELHPEIKNSQQFLVFVHKLGFSKADLAQVFGISEVNLNRWFTATDKPVPPYALAILIKLYWGHKKNDTALFQDLGLNDYLNPVKEDTEAIKSERAAQKIQLQREQILSQARTAFPGWADNLQSPEHMADFITPLRPTLSDAPPKELRPWIHENKKLSPQKLERVLSYLEKNKDKAGQLREEYLFTKSMLGSQYDPKYSLRSNVIRVGKSELAKFNETKAGKQYYILDIFDVLTKHSSTLKDKKNGGLILTEISSALKVSLGTVYGWMNENSDIPEHLTLHVLRIQQALVSKNSSELKRLTGLNDERVQEILKNDY